MSPSKTNDVIQERGRSPWKLGLLALSAVSFVAGCPSVAPPPSQFPTAKDALERMKATYRCDRGVHGEAKIMRHAQEGRIRGNLLFYAVRPANLRFDVLSPPPFQSIVATLTADGTDFSLFDAREKRFFVGPASGCNIARLTDVPIPGHALVTLLRGEAPLLVHRNEDLSIEWNKRGYYVVRIPSKHEASEEVRLTPTPADFGKPWDEQRLRVLDVRVMQKGQALWHAELSDHQLAPMSGPYIDPDHLEPPIPPSGPECHVEVPRKIHVEIPGTKQDVQFRYTDVKVNPPLPEGVFTQPVPGGVEVVPVTCE